MSLLALYRLWHLRDKLLHHLLDLVLRLNKKVLKPMTLPDNPVRYCLRYPLVLLSSLGPIMRTFLLFFLFLLLFDYVKAKILEQAGICAVLKHFTNDVKG